MGEPDDDAVLRAMRTEAERLATSGDALLRGQYEYLRARIDALIELRRVSGAD
ncbi:MAG: hypothetical protein JF588_05715 [Caulobacterales bacterium]|nr:hypothetical protein [Caulobacterales bacterium]